MACADASRFESARNNFLIKLERGFGDTLQFEDLLDNNQLFVLPKNLSNAQLATEGIAVVSPGSRLGKVLGGFANFTNVSF